MGVIAVDSSGTFEIPPIWVVAVRKVDSQKHIALEISVADCATYKKRLGVNYREKVSAAFIFKSIQSVIKTTDSIEIDKDFLGDRQKYVRQCLNRLFSEFYNGNQLSNPKIDFITIRSSKGKQHVKLAHKKTQLS